jgi:PAS domain S-box-containing protein
MDPRHQRVGWQFGTPVVTVAVATVATAYIPALSNKSSLLFFLGAVVLSTRIGGWSAGLLATLLSVVAIPYFMMEPIRSFSIHQPQDAIRLMVFSLVALMILSLHAARSKAESDLRASEQRLSLAIESAHMGVWDYNLLTRKFWWTRTLEQIYGRSGERFASSYGRFFGYIHFDDQPVFNRAITRTIDEGTDYDVDHRIVLPDDSIRWVNTRGRVFFNEKSRAERIVGITTDITAKKKFEMPGHLLGQGAGRAQEANLTNVGR